MRSGKYIRQITTMGMLVALAMVLGFVETLIPINLGIPGMKLGLAHIVVVIALFLFDVKTAVVVSILRIILIAMTNGVFTYLPVLMIAGLVSGALIGIVAGLISVRLTNVKIG